MPNRKLLTLSLSALLGAALLQSPLLQAEELPAAIKKIEAKGAKIVGSFDAPSGLKGYAAQYQNRGMALYLLAPVWYLAAQEGGVWFFTLALGAAWLAPWLARPLLAVVLT